MDHIGIRPFTENDIPDKVRWINDPENNKHLHYELPLEVDKTLRWFQNNKGRADRYDAVITYDGIAVGVIGLLSIRDRSAEYYITLGEQGYLHRGIAKQASLLLLEYAFTDLSLDCVYLYTEVNNISAQKLFEKCGFEQIRIEKRSAMNRGIPVDRYYYELGKERYVALWQDMAVMK